MKIKIWTIKNVICLQFIEIDKLEKYRNNGKIFTGRYFTFMSEYCPDISPNYFNLPGFHGTKDHIPFYIKSKNKDNRNILISNIKKDLESFGKFLNNKYEN